MIPIINDFQEHSPLGSSAYPSELITVCGGQDKFNHIPILEAERVSIIGEEPNVTLQILPSSLTESMMRGVVEGHHFFVYQYQKKPKSEVTGKHVMMWPRVSNDVQTCIFFSSGSEWKEMSKTPGRGGDLLQQLIHNQHGMYQFC
jgi:hypothetical protein